MFHKICSELSIWKSEVWYHYYYVDRSVYAESIQQKLRVQEKGA